jgi:hypothetical protein
VNLKTNANHLSKDGWRFCDNQLIILHQREQGDEEPKAQYSLA